jgi:hypothetical protein
MLGEKINKGKGCILKGMKGTMTYFKTEKMPHGSVNGGARSKVGSNGNITGGRKKT